MPKSIMETRNGKVCGAIILLSAAIGMTEKEAVEFCNKRGWQVEFKPLANG